MLIVYDYHFLRKKIIRKQSENDSKRSENDSTWSETDVQHSENDPKQVKNDSKRYKKRSGTTVQENYTKNMICTFVSVLLRKKRKKAFQGTVISG